jgi:hypothetical protein
MLFDDKGAYEHTERPKDLILTSLVRRLKFFGTRLCLGKEEATQALARTLTNWADAFSAKRQILPFLLYLETSKTSQCARSKMSFDPTGWIESCLAGFLNWNLMTLDYTRCHPV